MVEQGNSDLEDTPSWNIAFSWQRGLCNSMKLWAMSCRVTQDERIKGLHSQSYGFSSRYVWMWELDHNKVWAPKNWHLQIVVQRRLLGFPWTARRSSQSVLKEINPEYSLEWLMPSWSSNRLATWYEEPTHWKRLWYWERVKVGGRQKNREAWHAAVHGVTKIRTWLSGWKTTTRRQRRWGGMFSVAYLSQKTF